MIKKDVRIDDLIEDFIDVNEKMPLLSLIADLEAMHHVLAGEGYADVHILMTAGYNNINISLTGDRKETAIEKTHRLQKEKKCKATKAANRLKKIAKLKKELAKLEK